MSSPVIYDVIITPQKVGGTLNTILVLTRTNYIGGGFWRVGIVATTIRSHGLAWSQEGLQSEWDTFAWISQELSNTNSLLTASR